MRVDEVCSRVVHHVPVSCTLRDAARVMRDRHAKLLFVTEKAGPYYRILGVVTDRDMVVHGLADLPACADAPVSSVMTPGVITTEGYAAVSDAMRSMLAHGVRRLVVKDSEFTVIGILTLDDAVRSLGADVGILTDVLRRDREQSNHCATAAPFFRV